MDIDEAIVRQWLRDNKNNTAIDFNTCNVNRLVYILNAHQELVEKCVSDELGKRGNMWTDGILPTIDFENCGLEKCQNCQIMAVDPIESPEGVHLCKGCARFWNICHDKDTSEIEWSCATGRVHLWMDLIAECENRRRIAEKKRNQLVKPKRIAVAKSIPISEEYERIHEDDYDKAVDRSISFGESWKGTL